jgi:hypothetical protein
MQRGAALQIPVGFFEEENVQSAETRKLNDNWNFKRVRY